MNHDETSSCLPGSGLWTNAASKKSLSISSSQLNGIIYIYIKWMISPFPIFFQLNGMKCPRSFLKLGGIPFYNLSRKVQQLLGANFGRRLQRLFQKGCGWGEKDDWHILWLFMTIMTYETTSIMIFDNTFRVRFCCFLRTYSWFRLQARIIFPFHSVQ